MFGDSHSDSARMIGLIQRVTHASVEIKGEITGEIDDGLLVLVGVEANDNLSTANQLLRKIMHYRVFSDNEGKMNLSLMQVDGALLLVPQFTLVAETSKGLRPGFGGGPSPANAQRLFETLVTDAQATCPEVAAGTFGADMQVQLTNDGPVTFWLQVNPPAA